MNYEWIESPPRRTRRNLRMNITLYSIHFNNMPMDSWLQHFRRNRRCWTIPSGIATGINWAEFTNNQNIRIHASMDRIKESNPIRKIETLGQHFHYIHLKNLSECIAECIHLFAEVESLSLLLSWIHFENRRRLHFRVIAIASWLHVL